MNAEEIAALIAQASHEDPDLRADAASELPAALSGQPDDPALAALIRLTRDREAYVRERATFALGQLAEVDGPDIRSTLWGRVDDEDAETREEAVRGLAVRRDPRAVPLLAALLDEPTAYVQTFHAAAVLGDPRLLPSLRAYDPSDRGVQEALQACDPAAREHGDSSAWALLESLHALLPAADAALYASRFETNLTLSLGTGGHGELSWNADALLARADGDPERAASLAVSEVPSSSRDEETGRTR